MKNLCCNDFINFDQSIEVAKSIGDRSKICPVCGNKYFFLMNGDVETHNRIDEYLSGNAVSALPAIRGNSPTDRIIYKTDTDYQATNY